MGRQQGFELPTLDLIKYLNMLYEQPMVARLAQLVELEETRNEAMRKMDIQQAQMKRSFDKREGPITFKEGVFVSLVLSLCCLCAFLLLFVLSF